MPKKKKGPDPAALLAEQHEVERLTRDHYLSLFKREQSKSTGHRTAHKERGKVAGFDPQPPQHIPQEALDRLIERKAFRGAWEDAGDDDGINYAINEDADGLAHMDYMRANHHDVSDTLYLVTSAIDGISAKAELEVTDAQVEALHEAMDADALHESRRAVNALPHQTFVRAPDPADMLETIEALYQRKKEGAIEELARHLQTSYGNVAVLMAAVAGRFLSLNPTRTYFELLVMYLYTCDAVNIDRLLGLWSGEEPPAGYEPQSPDISTTIVTAIRERDLKTMGEWINFIAVLASCDGPLPTDKRGRTLYCGVKTMPPDLAAVVKATKADDVHYWSALSSCSLDLEVSAKLNPQVVFILRGVTAGVDLSQCAQTPEDSEVLLPPFSTFKVKSKIDAKKVELEFLGSATQGEMCDVSPAYRNSWKEFMQRVRENSLKLFSQQQILQQYQLATRRVQRHRSLVNQLANLLVQMESDAEAANATVQEKRPAAKGASAKQDDTQAGLDAQKVVLLDTHLQAAKTELVSLEKQLTAVNAAIASNKDLLGVCNDGTTADIKKLLKLQTEHYNSLGACYEKEMKKCEEIAARVAALRPAEKGKRGKKK